MKNIQKHRKNASQEALQSTIKIFLIFISLILLMNFVSAELFTFDNIKSFERTDNSFGVVTIRSFFGLGGERAEIELLENSHYCSSNCYAKGRITIYHSGKLADNFIFKDLSLRKDVNLEYKLFFKQGLVVKEINESICSKGKQIVYSNGSVGNLLDCKIITKEELVEDWVLYDGKDLSPGIYEWKLEGKKGARDVIDWQGSWYGVRVTEWAVWSGMTEYVETHGIGATAVEGGATAKSGPCFNESAIDVYLTSTRKYASDTATTAYLINSSDNATLATSTFSGNIATFDTILLPAKNKFCIYADSGGASYNRVYNNTGATIPYPVYGTYVNWLYNWEGSSNHNDQILNIFSINVTTSTDIGRINLSSPINYYNTSSNIVVFNCSATYPNEVTNISLYIDDVRNYIQNGVGSNFSEINISRTLADGVYNWSCRAREIGNTEGISEHRNFTIDTTPPIVNITSPYNFINYHINGRNLTINWSYSELSPQVCIGSFNNGINNITLVCANNNITINITSTTNNTFYFWMNDSSGNSANTSRTWSYKVFQENVSYSSVTTEGATESFILNFVQGGGMQTSTITLMYNSTAYPSSYSISSNNVTSTTTIVIPNYENKFNTLFYWTIVLSDGSKINTTFYNQTVNILNIDNCTAYSTVIYNYTMLDEETQEKLENTTMEIQINWYDSSKTTKILNFSGEYKETNPLRICFNGSLLENINYSIDSVVKYYSNDSGNFYVIRYYNILGQTITNTTVPKNINLYDLLSIKSTDFQLTFKDVNLAFASNILVYVYRQYIADNDFKVVEVPLTDSNGQTVLHLVRNDIIYNFVMVNFTGGIIATYNKMIAFCQDYTIGSCTIQLNVAGDTNRFYDYTDDLGISYTTPIYSNSTKLVSFDFISNNLSTVTVSAEIIRNNDFGNRSVCTNSLTSSTGTLTCNVSAVSATDRFLFVNIYVGGELKTSRTIDLEASSTGGFGLVNGAFYAFLFILLIICFFMDDKQALLVSLGIGWAVILALTLINGALIGALSGGIWLIVSIILMLTKLKKEEVG